MCGIFCSADKAVIQELARANAYRGQHSYSVTILDTQGPNLRFNETVRALGPFDIDAVPEYGFKICHIQAPTGENRSIETVHPAQSGSSKLWHNGIIKSFECDRLRAKQNSTQTWDTALLLNEVIAPNALDNLSEINGSFACLLIRDRRLYVFRNDLAPMFGTCVEPWFSSLSSVRLPGMVSITANQMFEINFVTAYEFDLDYCGQFKTKEMPYYFGDNEQ